MSHFRQQEDIVMGDRAGGIDINCTLLNHYVVCNGTKYILPEGRLTYMDEWFWIYIGLYVFLVLFAGLMSGLTMGLLSMDMMSLQVLKEGGTPSQQRHAKRIIPIVKRHHLLLVTLLLANAAAVESMPLFLDRVSDPITAIVVSVTAVLFFGEVFPQALCTRYGLAIGAALSPLVLILMGIFFIVAWPISKLLDCLLGTGHGTFFRRAELKVLVGLHGPPADDTDGDGHSDGAPVNNEEQLTIDEVLIIKGALEMKDKTVKNAMMPLESVFMLSVDGVLDEKTMDQIIDVSHSRIPIYEGTQENIIGIIIVKRLIKLDPEDAVPIKKLIGDEFYFRDVSYISETKPLFDTLNDFQTGKSHLSVVIQLPEEDVPTAERLKQGSIVGIITLEDVIEELIQEEIIDETDVYVDVSRRIAVARAKLAKRQNSSRPPPPLNIHRQLSYPSATLQAPSSDRDDRHSIDVTFNDSDRETSPLLV